MCGFTYDEAVGRNPRLTQGERSDQASIMAMSTALRQQRACKVMMLNYRHGQPDRPFWNMLSISPIVHQGQLMLYLANLQDYSYHMSKLVSTPPTQFCRSAEHQQMIKPLPAETMSLRYYARPAVFEMAPGAAPIVEASASSASNGSTQLQLKRLGWANLTLEPEHLTDRVVDALHQLEARYERAETAAEGDDVFVVNAEISGVACRILVTADPNSHSYRISCTRLGGDTFAYHDVFRQLRGLLGDAVQGATSLMGAGGIASRAGMGGGGMRRPSLMPIGLAPLPAGIIEEQSSSNPTGGSCGGGGGGGGGGSQAGGPSSEQ